MTYKYYCKKCNYGSENKYNYSTHIKTSKHINLEKSICTNELKIHVNDLTHQQNGYIHQQNGVQKNNSSGITKEVHKLNRKKISKHVICESDEEYKLNEKKPSKSVICEYCNKHISYANHKARHYRNCSERKKLDHNKLLQRLEQLDQKAEDAITFNNKLLIERLKFEKEKAEQKAEEAIKSKQALEKSKQELEKDYREHVKITTELLKNCSNTTINNNIDKRQMNIYYVIDKYTDAYNYDDIISKKLTRAEKDHIKMFGPSAACESIIMNRCVNGIPKNKRPIHCIDASREKFVYRTEGEWAIDLNGDKIMGPAMAQVRTQFDISDKNTDIDDRVNSQRLLLDMDMNARRRTVKNLKKATLLKNKQ